ncbi:ChaB family protein [Inquilinus sp. OTU3971]|uniref:ChaB family protein n=1 Tax=Inquilinus sp. OTU3971 TaxID=3043855 RepID=UPI00313CC804
MPYPSIDDLPWPVRSRLPQHAQEIYRGAFNSAWSEYAARGAEQRERSAHRVAWAAVKRLYRKEGDLWVARQR